MGFPGTDLIILKGWRSLCLGEDQAIQVGNTQFSPYISREPCISEQDGEEKGQSKLKNGHRDEEVVAELPLSVVFRVA
jgi:hypothetical protein